MAMDDIYRLVQAALIDGRMTRPASFDEHNQPVGQWYEAEVVDASVTMRHSDGWFNGHVRFRLKDEMYAHDATMYQLWVQGWTTFEYRDQVLAARTKRRKRSAKRK